MQRPEAGSGPSWPGSALSFKDFNKNVDPNHSQPPATPPPGGSGNTRNKLSWTDSLDVQPWLILNCHISSKGGLFFAGGQPQKSQGLAQHLKTISC